jgi:hypothetical protein
MRYDRVMRLRFLLGLVLVAGALAAAAAEVVARDLGATHAPILSAYDLWYTLRPGSLVVAEAQIERLSPLLWDPVIVTVLALPAWLLFGAPGLLLIWRYSPRRGGSDIDEEAMFLYDRLAKRARDEGYDDDVIPFTLPPRRTGTHTRALDPTTDEPGGTLVTLRPPAGERSAAPRENEEPGKD